MRIIGSALTPTGKHETWWHVDDNRRDRRVRNYGEDEIFEYIMDRKLVYNPIAARRIAENLNVYLYDWNDGTDVETTWDQLIRAAVMQDRDRVYRP